jgi:hypothetical protein
MMAPRLFWLGGGSGEGEDDAGMVEELDSVEEELDDVVVVEMLMEPVRGMFVVINSTLSCPL